MKSGYEPAGRLGLLLLALALLLAAPAGGQRWGEGAPTGGPGGASSYTRSTTAADYTNTQGSVFMPITEFAFTPAANTKYNVICNVVTESLSAGNALQFQITGPALTLTAERVVWARQYCVGTSVTPSNATSSAVFFGAAGDDGITNVQNLGILCPERHTFSLWNGPNTTPNVEIAFVPENNGFGVSVLAGSYCERTVVP